MLLAAGLCIAVLCRFAGLPESQKAAERWQGDSELTFEQVSCFIPEDRKIGTEAVNTFRAAAEKAIHEAALDIVDDSSLFVDCWSTNGTVTAATDRGSCECAVIAVGGEYFSFHPITLKYGTFLTGHDLNKDLIMLDEDVAWRLFGGYDLQGSEVWINGKSFFVAGVVAREDDFVTRKAYTAGMGIYMSYEGYESISDKTGISCYEIVLPEPVDGFALGVVEKHFPIDRGEIVDNTERFDAKNLFRVVKQFGERSMQTKGVIYPYWENAARYLEDWCALLLLAAVVLLAVPAVTVVVVGIRLIARGKETFEEELWPKWKDNAQEAVRSGQRKRREKKRGNHQK